MGKIAFLFSGQGSQYVGMGKEIADRFDSAKAVFDQADEALGFSISNICFEGDEASLNRTENTQPAILATSAAILAVIRDHGIEADVVAGLSLGEYTALVSNGVLDFNDAVQLVKKRGRYMQEAVPEGVGTMAALLGMEREAVLDLCKELSTEGIIEPANFNCKGQIVIAGEVPVIEKAVEKAPALGARRAMMLKVSGPFHSSMLAPAAEKLAVELENVNFKEAKLPYLTNVTGDFVTDEDKKELLKKQVMSSVYWEDSVKKMIEDGVETFIEIGPGKALSSFVKKVDRKKNIYNVEDLKTLSKLLKDLKDVEIC